MKNRADNSKIFIHYLGDLLPFMVIFEQTLWRQSGPPAYHHHQVPLDEIYSRQGISNWLNYELCLGSCGVATKYSGAKSHFKGKKNRQKWSPYTSWRYNRWKKFVLVNLHNANPKKDQLNTINKLSEILNSANNISAKQIILGGDCNLYWKS